MHSACDRLDDYLCGCQSRDERQAFERHLTDCGTCREEVVCQQQFDRLLRQATSHKPSDGLANRIEGRIRVATRRRRVWQLSGLAAAACVFAALAWHVRPQPAPLVTPELVSKPLAAMPVARVVVDPQCELLAVPKKSSQPNVTIYWLYPTISTASSGDPETDAKPTSESKT